MINPLLFQSDMIIVAPNLNKMDKVIRVNLVNNIDIQLVNSKINYGGRIPHGELNKHLDDAKRVCPTISRNMNDRDVHLHWSSLIIEDIECGSISNENNCENSDYSRWKGGRLVGSSIVSKYEPNLRRVKVHTDVSIIFALETKVNT